MKPKGEREGRIAEVRKEREGRGGVAKTKLLRVIQKRKEGVE